jgi:MFS superfamily sulfate permease-like transporter
MLLASLRGIRPAWIPSDCIAGLMVAAIAIPEQIATARLAGMPPQTGLYAFAAGSLVFALFGLNRYLSAGADSTIAPIFAGAVAALVAGGAVTAYAELIALTALLTGALLLLAGSLRAGWIADLLSVPVTVGFLAGIAVHIVAGQLPLVLGVPAHAGSPIVQLIALAPELAHVNPAALAIGAGVLIVTLAAARVSPRIPGALAGLIGAGIAVAALRLDEHGVAVLGALPATAPHLALPTARAHDALQLVPIALIVALVCMVQTAVVLRSYPSNPGTTEDPSRDFAAIGIGSIAAALVGAFAVDASPPRTAVAASSGARSQLAGVIAVAAVVALAGFGAQLAAYLPLAALGGVLIYVGVRLFRLGDMTRIARSGGYEIWLVVAGALLVIVLPIESGMLFAIVLSLVHGIYIVARPPSTELLRVPGTTIWWPSGDDQQGTRIPGVLVFAPAAPITFTNGHSIVERLFAAVAAATSPVHLVVLEGSGVIDIDYTGAGLLCNAIANLRSRGIVVAIARLEGSLARHAAEQMGVFAALGANREFRSVQEALEALAPDSAPAPSTR